MYFLNINEYLNAVLHIMSEINDKKNFKLTHLKLQKVLYIIYAYYLVFKEKRILKIQFQAWRYGPVIYEIWSMYKEFGKNQIPHIKNYNLKQIQNDLGEEYKNFYNIIKFLIEVDVWELVEICHIESPWQYIYVPMKNILIDDAWILKDHMDYQHKFFKEIHLIICKNV